MSIKFISFVNIAGGRTNRSLLVQAGPPVRRAQPRAQPVFSTTIDIAEFVPADQIQVPDLAPRNLLINNNVDPVQIQAQREQMNAQQEIIIEQQDGGERVIRNIPIGQAPRNRAGVLRDLGDRALEAGSQGSDHMGLPLDDLTEHSFSASQRQPTEIADGVLGLDVIPNN